MRPCLDIVFPVDRPSPVVAVVVSCLNAVFVIWGVDVLSSANCTSVNRLGAAWLAVGVGCAAINMSFVCWLVWQLQRRVLHDTSIPEGHSICKLVMCRPLATGVYFTLGLVLEVLWMVLAFKIRDGTFGTSNDRSDADACTAALPVGVSVLCVHWVLLLGGIGMSIMTECCAMPRWRLRLIARAIRRRETTEDRAHHQNGAPSGNHLDVERPGVDDLPPFTGDLSKSMESQRLEQGKPQRPYGHAAAAEEHRGRSGGRIAPDAESEPLKLWETAREDKVVAVAPERAAANTRPAFGGGGVPSRNSATKYHAEAAMRPARNHHDADDEELPDFV